MTFDAALKVGQTGDTQARQTEQLQGVPDLLGVGGVHAFVVGELHELFDHGDVFAEVRKVGRVQRRDLWQVVGGEVTPVFECVEVAGLRAAGAFGYWVLI